MLNLLYRQADPTLIDVSKPVEVDKERARAIVGGLMFNFITEGFHLMEHNNGKLAPYLAMLNGNAPANPKDSVALVKALMLDFIDRARAVVLVPAAATQTITQYAANHPILGMQVARDYGSIMQHEQTIARTVAKQ